MRTKQESALKSKRSAAVTWILAAFGLLAIGVIAGAIAGTKSWSWAFPAVGFVGYLLAFRRGLTAWEPEGIDLAWRDAPQRGRRVESRPASPENPPFESRAARLTRGAFPNAGQIPHGRPRQF